MIETADTSVVYKRREEAEEQKQLKRALGYSFRGSPPPFSLSGCLPACMYDSEADFFVDEKKEITRKRSMQSQRSSKNRKNLAADLSSPWSLLR